MNNIKKLNCIIVDDEPIALEILESYIAQNEHLNLVKKCVHAIEASESIKIEKPDLVFLDINMPEVSGLDLAKSIKGGPMIVFTTAYDEYAVDAFEINAIDYLMKPISPSRFDEAVQRCIEYKVLRARQQDGGGEETDIETENDFIFVKSEQKLIKIAFSDILYVEALADYVKIYIAEGKRIITLQTMKNMTSKLPTEKFVRVHRSFIISLAQVKSLSANEVDIGARKIPVGKNYKDDFLSKINKNVFK